MQRRTTIWFLLLFQPILILTQNHSEPYDCKIGSLNPLATTSLNACFKLYDTPKSYQAARRHCVSLGGQLADKINKDDSSLYSANADLEVANATKFWVGASNLKCNIAWENGGEIEFNEMWAPDSRYYGVAIDKMSIGGLWHTIPVGQKLPFVCTFQGKSKDAPAPVHAMRAPAKKRAKVEAAKEEDIDESKNAALADERKKEEAKSEKKEESKKDEEEINESMNAALSDEKKAAMSASEKKESSSKDEESTSDEASMSAQLAINGSAALSASMSAASSSSNSTSDESLDEVYDSAEIAMRAEIGKTAVAMKSQEMASQSEDYDKYTEEDLVSAAASLIGGYTINANWADSRTKNSSTFDSETDEESMSMSITVADQMAMAMQSANRRESETSSSDSESESSSDQTRDSASISMAAAMAASSNSSSKSESNSKDESEDSASISMEQKAQDSVKLSAESASKSESNKSNQEENVEEADVASAASIFGSKNSKDPKPTKTTKSPKTTEEPDIDESLNAALANQRSTPTNKPDLTTVLTTLVPSIAVASKPTEKIPGCPAEWTQFNTNSTAPALCFKRFEKPMNFEDARLFCVGKGGHLASIHNERQLLLLSALLHNNGPDVLSDQTWIGLNRIHQKYYVYEDETAMDFTRWLPGAPNINDCTVFTGNELPNYPHKGTQYKFGDFPCEETQKSVLCEVNLGKDKTKTQPTCQEGWSYYSYDGTAKNGKCYKRLDQSKKFTEARDVCKKESSYVASVQNEGEARFISALVQTGKNYTVDEQTWIGYVKYEKDFGWEDGNKGLQFDPWTEKMPREKKCVVFTGNEIHEDCRSQFRFVSVDCNKNQRSILCSKPPMINGVPFVFKDTENSSKKI